MTTDLIYFTVGIAILLFSSEVLVRLSAKVSQFLKISPLIIGLTVVAIGTSLPELAVSIVATSHVDSGLALGNIVGSNIINILFVFAIGILMGKVRVGTTKTQSNSVLLLAITAFFVTVRVLHLPNIIFGSVLIGLAIAVSILEYHWAILGREHEDIKLFSIKKSASMTLIDLLAILLAVVGIIFGGLFVVNSVEKLSQLTGYSTTVLGLSLTAIATSLPELLTTILGAREHQEKIVLGNIIGSNTYNLLLVGGIISLLSSPNGFIAVADWIWLIGSTLLFVIILQVYRGRAIPRFIGMILLIFFVFYIYSLTLLN